MQRGSYYTLAMEGCAAQKIYPLQPQSLRRLKMGRSGEVEVEEVRDEEDEELEEADEVLLEGWEPRDKKTLVLVDVSGVYQLIVSWCCCPNAPDKQLSSFNIGSFLPQPLGHQLPSPLVSWSTSTLMLLSARPQHPTSPASCGD
jgi:hypothetical protein